MSPPVQLSGLGFLKHSKKAATFSLSEGKGRLHTLVGLPGGTYEKKRQIFRRQRHINVLTRLKRFSPCMKKKVQQLLQCGHHCIVRVYIIRKLRKLLYLLFGGCFIVLFDPAHTSPLCSCIGGLWNLGCHFSNMT